MTDAFRNAMRTGGLVAVILAFLTVVEYVFAVNVDSDQVRFFGLALAAIAKSWLIVYFFMHVYRIWRAEAH